MLAQYQHVFFMGVAGTGMSALAQYLQGVGVKVSGSDRYFKSGESNDMQTALELAGIHCFPQDGSGMDATVDLVVASTAVEEQVPEMVMARALGIPVIRRSDMLALIADSKRTIAVGGTSGKSTTAAMLYHILDHAGLQPSIISGAGLVTLMRAGKIGNAAVGSGDWLVIEADESDGSIVSYHAAIGLLLNIDKDHKEVNELMDIFGQFQQNSQRFITNLSHPLAASLSQASPFDFSWKGELAGLMATHFVQTGLQIQFKIQDIDFTIRALGKHNMENALAAVAAAHACGVSLAVSAAALQHYEGIYRRHQVYGQKNGVWFVDDYAHNPAKCAASIAACQPVAPKVVAWFQPHGYGPTRFLRADFVREIANVLRPSDEIWMSEIFYAGGTATKDISANDLIEDLKKLGKQAYFVESRAEFLETVRPHLQTSCVLLLMGARDPSLEKFAENTWQQL
jgi:UDP-N-acetylmuramate--alanine ligase